MSIDYAKAIATRPSTADVPKVYGTFRYQESTKQVGAVIPDPQWSKENLVHLDLTRYKGFPPSGGLPSKSIWLHKQVAPVFDACMTEAAELGLLSKLKEYNGCYVPRHMGWNKGRPLSVHSWGAAVDFDASSNAYGSARMGIDRDFVRLMEERGWSWGGRWTGNYADGMHFEYVDPLPGVQLASWQDAKATMKKPVPVVVKRRVMLEGQVITEGRYAYSGVTVAIMPDGSAYLRPATKEEMDGKIIQPAAPQGISPRVTLLDQADVWVPFAGRAIYRGLMLNLDGQTGDLWIRKATSQEIAK